MRHMRSLLQDVVRLPPTVAIKRLRSPSELASQDTGRVTGQPEVIGRDKKRDSIFSLPLVGLEDLDHGEMTL